MIATSTRTYRLGEFHRFEGGGRQFLYLVPAGAIFELDTAAATVIGLLSEGAATPEELLEKLTQRDFAATDAAELIQEMFLARVIVAGDSTREPIESPPADFPLQTLVMNLTNQCNLSCQYCYEFGEDKVATPEGKPKFMDLATAKASVDFLLEQVSGRKAVHITFFGGETLMNFPAVEAGGELRQPARRGAGTPHRLQSHHQCDAIDAGDYRVSLGEPHRRDRQHGWSGRIARQAARVRQWQGEL